MIQSANQSNLPRPLLQSLQLLRADFLRCLAAADDPRLGFVEKITNEAEWIQLHREARKIGFRASIVAEGGFLDVRFTPMQLPLDACPECRMLTPIHAMGCPEAA